PTPVTIKLAVVTIPLRQAIAMASFTRFVNPKSSAATMSFLVDSMFLTIRTMITECTPKGCTSSLSTETAHDEFHTPHFTQAHASFATGVDDGAASVCAGEQCADTRQRHQSRDACCVGSEAIRRLLSGTLRNAGAQSAGNIGGQSSNRLRTTAFGFELGGLE